MQDTVKEEWKVIQDFPRYSISNKGNVRSNAGKEPIILKPNIIGKYACVKLYRYDTQKMSECKLFLIHRLVAQYFCKDFSEDKQIHHKDRNTRNNNAENLLCLTQKQHQEEHKRINTGSAKGDK